MKTITEFFYPALTRRWKFFMLPVAWLLAVLLALASFPAAMSSASAPNKPLVVDQNSHVVVMEYEAWFGPKAVTFQGTAAKPLLQSKDMKKVGGGYDSADPAVIRQQAAWLQAMGMDAALIEVTNNVSCIFNSVEFLRRYGINYPAEFHRSNQIILQNTGNLYPAWTDLGTPLKLIPMVGGIDQDVLYPDIDGKTAFERNRLFRCAHAGASESERDLSGQATHPYLSRGLPGPGLA